MSLVDRAMDVLLHPQVLPMVQGWVREQIRPSETDDPWRRYDARLDEILTEVRATKATRPGRPRKQAVAAAPEPAPGPDPVLGLRDRVQLLAGTLDEAMRFAREPNGGGVEHPDAATRLADARQAADWLLEVERFALLPQETSGRQRAMANAVLPTVRRLRESLQSGLGTVEGADEAAALAGRLSTMLQVAAMTGQVPEAPAGGSVYAVQTEKGCIPCMRGHLGFLSGSLGKAAELAERAGVNDAHVAKRLDSARRELAVMLRYDLTPERVANNPPAEQDAIRRYQPEVEALLADLGRARTPADVGRAAERARSLWGRFDAETAGMGEGMRAAAAWNRPLAAVGDADALIDPAYRSWGYVAPRRSDLPLVAERTNYAELMATLQEATERDLGATWQTVDERVMEQVAAGAEAVAIPATRTVLRTAAVATPQNLSLQTAIHEIAHLLLQAAPCFPEGAEEPVPPAVRDYGEREADLVTIGAMSSLGLPLQFTGGTTEPPGAYELDWQALREHLGAREESRIRWGVRWVVDAAQHAQPAAADTCPPPPPIALVRTVSGRQFGYGLA